MENFRCYSIMKFHVAINNKKQKFYNYLAKKIICLPNIKLTNNICRYEHSSTLLSISILEVRVFLSTYCYTQEKKNIYFLLGHHEFMITMKVLISKKEEWKREREKFML